jgi:hypothetical protein
VHLTPLDQTKCVLFSHITIASYFTWKKKENGTVDTTVGREEGDDTDEIMRIFRPMQGKY